MSWKLDGATGVPSERLEAWQGDVQEASATSSLVLALNTQDGDTCVALPKRNALLQGMEVESEVDVNVSISTRNWQNHTDFASALVKALWPKMQADTLARQVVPGRAPPLSAGRRVLIEASQELRLEAHSFPFLNPLAHSYDIIFYAYSPFLVSALIKLFHHNSPASRLLLKLGSSSITNNASPSEVMWRRVPWMDGLSKATALLGIFGERVVLPMSAVGLDFLAFDLFSKERLSVGRGSAVFL